MGSKRDTEQAGERFGYKFRLIVASFPQSAAVEGHRNNGIGDEVFWLAFDEGSQAPGKPLSQGSHVSVLQQQNRARHPWRVRSEAAREVKGIPPGSAKMAKRRRSRLDNGG